VVKDRLADGGGEHAVEGEHDEAHDHERRAQREHRRELVPRVAGDELRQEREEEDGQFRVEEVGQARREDHAARGLRVPFVSATNGMWSLQVAHAMYSR
jgi:hypothetical protein